MCSSEEQKREVAQLGNSNLGIMFMITEGKKRVVLNAEAMVLKYCPYLFVVAFGGSLLHSLDLQYSHLQYGENNTFKLAVKIT